MNDELVNILHDRKILLDKNEPISVQQVYEWMHSPYLEVQGSVFSLLFERPECLELPPVEEINEFQLKYLEQCLRDNSEGVYVHSRYMAAHTIRAWFQRLWVQKPKPENILEDIQDMLARLCQEGDVSLNDAVVTAVLEHLFESSAICDFFSNWKNSPNLAETYNEAVFLSSQNP